MKYASSQSWDHIGKFTSHFFYGLSSKGAPQPLKNLNKQKNHYFQNDSKIKILCANYVRNICVDQWNYCFVNTGHIRNDLELIYTSYILLIYKLIMVVIKTRPMNISKDPK